MDGMIDYITAGMMTRECLEILKEIGSKVKQVGVVEDGEERYIFHAGKKSIDVFIPLADLKLSLDDFSKKHMRLTAELLKDEKAFLPKDWFKGQNKYLTTNCVLRK